MLRLQVFFLNLHVKAQLQLPPRLFVRTHDFHSLCGSCDCHGIESVCVCVRVILSMQTSLEDQTKPRNQLTKLVGWQRFTFCRETSPHFNTSQPTTAAINPPPFVLAATPANPPGSPNLIQKQRKKCEMENCLDFFWHRRFAIWHF